MLLWYLDTTRLFPHRDLSFTIAPHDSRNNQHKMSWSSWTGWNPEKSHHPRLHCIQWALPSRSRILLAHWVDCVIDAPKFPLPSADYNKRRPDGILATAKQQTTMLESYPFTGEEPGGSAEIKTDNERAQDWQRKEFLERGALCLPKKLLTRTAANKKQSSIAWSHFSTVHALYLHVLFPKYVVTSCYGKSISPPAQKRLVFCCEPSTHFFYSRIC